MITGTVVAGKRLGRTMNFPTANIETDAGSPVPARGVYAAYAHVGPDTYAAIMNVGVHPTLPEGGPTVEVHLLDYAGDLYGQRLAVEPVYFLRPERRFASKDALAKQLEHDANAARERLK